MRPPLTRLSLTTLAVVGMMAVTASLVAAPVATAARAADTERAGRAGSATGSNVVIGLRRNQNALAAFAQSHSTPGAAAYRNYGSVSSLARRYGATDATWSQVRQYLRRKGIRNVKLDVTRGFATARLSRRERRRAFPAPSGLRRLMRPVLFEPGSGQRSPRVAPTRPHVVARSASPNRTGTPAGCSQGVGSGGLTPNQYRTAYGVDPLHARGVFGQGTRIAFVEFDGFSQADLDRFARCFGFVAPRPTVHRVGLRQELPPGNETQLDTQIVSAIAPRARMDIFESGDAPGDLVRLFAAPLDPAKTGGAPPNVISASLGFCELMFEKRAARLLDYVLAMAAGAGISVVNAAGDNGSSACFTKRLAVAYPGSSTFVTSVGGTRLTLTPGNEIASEVVWNDFPFGAPSAGGGGTSRIVHRPDYQQGQAGGFGFRKVPDVVFHSSGFPGYAILSDEGSPQWAQVDGTSAAAPLLAAGTSLAVQAAARAGVKPPGPLNPLLYQAGDGGAPALFNDLTRGDNDLFRVGCCSARPGYDRASGWGSLDLSALADLVVATGR
jgi:kumamolisin